MQIEIQIHQHSQRKNRYEDTFEIVQKMHTKQVATQI